jgi:hypothetical protein
MIGDKNLFYSEVDEPKVGYDIDSTKFSLEDRRDLKYHFFH